MEKKGTFGDRQKKTNDLCSLPAGPIFWLVSFWHQAYHSSNLGLTDDFVRSGINGLNTWDRVENWGNPVGREGRVCLDYKLRSCALPETPWEPISSPHEGRDQQTYVIMLIILIFVMGGGLFWGANLESQENSSKEFLLQ